MPVSPQERNQQLGDGGSERGEQDGTREGGTEAKDSGAGEEIKAPQEEEETQCQKVLRVPDAPTKEEIAEHHASGHLPYRSWCSE